MNIAKIIVENYEIDEAFKWAEMYRNLYLDLDDEEFAMISDSILAEVVKAYDRNK